MIQFNYSQNLLFSDADIQQHQEEIAKAYQQLTTKSGKGNDFLGWLDLPEETDEVLLSQIQNCANRLERQSEMVVVIGIGGSYLGARAVIEALQHSYKGFNPFSDNHAPYVTFAGNNISEDNLCELLEVLDHKDYSLIVISKSGTTTEPAIAFRILKKHCEDKYGKEWAKQRIVAITDKARGALKQMADANGYETFVIPDDVGGRYSVLTPVGLLPIAVAGFDIRQLIAGARAMRHELLSQSSLSSNIAQQYALMRYLLYQSGKKIEMMVTYNPKMAFFIEWYKQLFGESEGKEGKGIFPTGATFSTDLHSLGQYIQEGERHLFETVLSIQQSRFQVPIPEDAENLDKLNYLLGKSIQEINLTAEEGTRMAHVDGKVPNLRLIVPKVDENNIGQLIYFFEFSCALGGYLLGINPFDQPGVEAYKKNMFRLLGKPQ
ncbi:MAG: glucose-6-phosphate isomerase [Bacteroidales bacterium]|jgi:glucose-6-phosphate isomerase|nr:glucose-6-phosphate isomerase [Bacteroidales bacterium]